MNSMNGRRFWKQGLGTGNFPRVDKPAASCRRLATAALLALGITAMTLQPDPAAAQSSAPTTITVGLIPAQFLSILPALGERIGAYRKRGLAINYINTNNSPAIVAALASGSADFGIVPPVLAFPAMARGSKMLFLMNNYDVDFSLLGKPSLMSGASAGYPTALRALSGKRVGVTSRGALSETYVLKMLADAGVPASEVALVAVGSGAAAVGAFMNDQIDAMVVFAPTESLMPADKFVRLVDAKTTKANVYGDALIYTAWAASAQATAGKPAAVEGFCAALKETFDYLRNPANKDMVIGFLAEYVRLSSDKAAQTYATYLSNFSPKLTEAVWNKQSAFTPAAVPVWRNSIHSTCVSGG